MDPWNCARVQWKAMLYLTPEPRNAKLPDSIILYYTISFFTITIMPYYTIIILYITKIYLNRISPADSMLLDVGDARLVVGDPAALLKTEREDFFGG